MNVLVACEESQRVCEASEREVITPLVVIL